MNLPAASMRLLMAMIVCLGAAACRAEEPKAGVLYEKKSEFNHIIVAQDGTGYRSLKFSEDGAVQSAQDVNRPGELVISYTRAAMLGPALRPGAKRMLMVGLGGGSMPMFLRKLYPEAQIDVVELDPAVVEVASKYFGFKEDGKMKAHVGDGRAFIEKTENRYDIIFLDAYGIDYIPYSLATREFLHGVKKKLSDDGIVVANVWSGDENELYDSMVKTYLDVFPGLSIIKAPASQNRILVATRMKGSISKERWIEVAKAFQERHRPHFNAVEMVESGYVEVTPPARGKVLVDADAPKE